MSGVRQFCVGWREGALKQLINVYKFQAVRAAGGVLSDLAGIRLGDYRGFVVPLPTIRRHIRERGFDHTRMIARGLALPCVRVLRRARNTVQVGTDAETRKRQAECAYAIKGQISPEQEYLLLDDIWTTGSSMKAAVALMQKAGAKRLAVLVMARNVSD